MERRPPRIVGITYRQLDYWARTDLIRPSLTDAAGSGSRRRYSYRDLLELQVIKSLLDAGIKLESVRTVFEYLRDPPRRPTSPVAHLVISGSDVILCDGERAHRRHAPRRPGRAQRARRSAASKIELDSHDRRARPATRSTRRRLARCRGACDERAPSTARSTPCTARSAPRWCPFGGWEMPLSYPTGTIDEHLACRNDAVVFDVSHLGTVRVEGADAAERLQAALTNDLDKIAPGRAQYTHLLDEVDASVLDDIIVWWVDDEVFDVMPNASNTDRVRLGDRRQRDHARSRRARRAGPARQGARWPTVFPEAAAVGRFRVSRLTWEGIDCVVAGTGYTGEAGVEIAVPAAAARPICGPRSPAPASRRPGLGARDTLRLEAGLPLHGHELGAGHHAAAGRVWAGSWLGRRTSSAVAQPLAAERAAGVSRLLHGHRHRWPPAAARRLRGARRRSVRSAWSPAATSRPCSATASPWRSCHPTSRSAPRSSSTCAAQACRAASSPTPFIPKH